MVSRVVHVDCPGCGAPVDPRRADAGTFRCGYCGAVGVVKREGDRLVFEQTVLGEAASRGLAIWRYVAVPVAAMLGAALLVAVGLQAVRPGLGEPVEMAVLTLLSALVLRFRANPLVAAFLALAVGAVMSAKPFVWPIRIGRFDAFGPTSETALHWGMPGAILVIVGLFMIGTLSRARLAGAFRLARPTLAGVALTVIGGAAGIAARPLLASETLFERLEASSASLDALEASLAAVSDLTSTAPLPDEVRAALRAAPGTVDLLMRDELAGPPPQGSRMSPGVLSPLLVVRRELRDETRSMYTSDLHEPLREHRRALFEHAERLRTLVIVDLDPPYGSQTSDGTRYTATGTVVDLTSRTALGVVTGGPDASAYTATSNLRRALGLPEH